MSVRAKPAYVATSPSVMASIVRTIDAITEGDVATYAGFARTDINYIGIGIRNRDAADGGGALLVEERIPGNAAIRGFPNAAGHRPKIISVRLAGNAGDGQHPSATE